LRPGEGGDDAAGFCTELAEAITAYVRRRGGQVSARYDRTTRLAITGLDAGELEAFVGTHRIQRIPTNDRRGRRHTSTATVALLGALEAGAVLLEDADLEVTYYRGRGKGGQHRNTTDSAVRVRHIPTGIVVTIENGRQQGQNLTRARAELLRRLSAREGAAIATARNTQRRSQITSGERPTKQWTWNEQRGEVLEHRSGRRYEMDAMLRGRVELN
jgi:peptide chain release factor 1